MTEEIRFSTAGGLATVELARPKALNALTYPMVQQMADKLEAWEHDDAIGAVVIKGEGERAFCAGGDVRAVWKSVMEDMDGKGPSELSKVFFFDEYRLNHQIHAFSKPFVALLDGVTMGGGVGVSIHGSHRIATERLMFAMPETGIGLFPDVGGGWFLPRLPGETGTYLALTGARLDAAGACALGISTHFVPSSRLEGFEAQLATAIAGGSPARAAVNDVLERLAEPAGEDPLTPHRGTIDTCFKANSVEEVLDALAADGSDFARETRDTLLAKSPTSLKISLELMRRGREASNLADVLLLEYRLSQACMAGHDYYEGIRAVLIDKDHAPKWRPATVAEVGRDIVAAHFSAPASGDWSLA
ncbi:MAG: enoyl-CoA hydratase/isomerase family protein [Thalassobaculaceae bacterium]|nr:enoyl-CoA hydratase/isomerase family protein [Thalassobaculaceae bacterium]